MAEFKVKALELEGAFQIEAFYNGDNRGSFTKNFEEKVFEENGIQFSLSESFYSCSEQNVIRGLHFQRKNPQAKLVSVIQGRAWDVIVDLRMDSETFSKWICVELSAENHRSLYVPRGFAHGFASLENKTIMLYQCDGAYDKETDTGIRFDDSEIGIEWPINEGSAIYSKRDLGLMSLQEYVEQPMELGGVNRN